MRTNDEHLDLFADLMLPVSEILTDEAVISAYKGEEGKPIKAVRAAIKGHHRAIVEILATLEGVDPDEYIVPPPAALLMKILNLINDPDVQSLFTLQGQTGIAASSGSATETTQEKEKDGV